MFRITKDPSSGRLIQYLAKITRMVLSCPLTWTCVCVCVVNCTHAPRCKFYIVLPLCSVSHSLPNSAFLILTPMKILQRNLNTFVNQLDDEELSIGYFQQDGATSYTSHASMAEIQSFFGDRVISKGLRLPRSPDLTPPRYFLWGYLKATVYRNKPRNIDALKQTSPKKLRQ